MFWNLIFMLSGALIFAAGVVFERGLPLSVEESENLPEEEESMPTRVLKQWENLLGYDGNEQEDEDEDL